MKLLSFALILSAVSATTVCLAGTTIYGLKSRASSVPSTTPTRLFSFDGTNGGFQDIGAVTYNGNQVDADGLAWSEIGLTAFLLESDGSRLVSVNPTTAVAITLAFYPAKVIRGATARGGTLYALDVLANSHYNLAKINLGTFTSTSIVLNTGIADVCDLDFAANGELWVTDMNAFLKLDPLTGVLTLVATDAIPESGASPAANAGFVFDETSAFHSITYEVTANDDIYTYALPVATRTMFISNILPSYNAGRGDLAAVPEPATSAAFALALALLAKRRRR